MNGVQRDKTFSDSVASFIQLTLGKDYQLKPFGESVKKIEEKKGWFCSELVAALL